MATEKSVKKPACKLVGTDGNVFSIIARVRACLRDAKMPEKAAEFSAKAMASKSYGDVLVLCSEYVRIK